MVRRSPSRSRWTWSSEDTDALLDVLRRGSPRAIRLLDVTGVLERGIPTVADARRPPPRRPDRARSRARAAVPHHRPAAGAARRPRRRSTGVVGRPRASTVTLAALVIDVAGIDAGATAVRRLLEELAIVDPRPVGARAGVVADADRRRGRPGRRTPRPSCASWPRRSGPLDTAELAYVLAVASSSDRRRRERLDELHALRRRPAAAPRGVRRRRPLARRPAPGRGRGPDDGRGRAGAACATRPVSYLLTHEPDELARQARLVEPLPPQGTVRVAVSPDEHPDHWLVDVACRDADGVLARLAGALTATGCDIAAATVATWADGAVVDTFLVRSAVRPRARRLAEQMEAGLRGRLVVEPLDRPRHRVRQRLAAVADVVHGQRAGPAGDPVVARRRVRVRRCRRAQRPAEQGRRRDRRPLLPQRPARSQARRAGDGPGLERARTATCRGGRACGLWR